MDPKVCVNPGRSDQDIIDHLGAGVVAWLPTKVRDLLRDYFVIKRAFLEHGIGNTSLYDFSYLITPAFKALEGTLLHIAEELRLDTEKSRFRIGWIFKQEELDRFYVEVLDRLEDISTEERLEIRVWLNNTRQILHHLRHTPAHYLAEPKHPHTQAFLTGDTIVFTIKEMITSLLSSGVFGKAQLKHVMKNTVDALKQPAPS